MSLRVTALCSKLGAGPLQLLSCWRFSHSLPLLKLWT